ncbi:unnamed protein product [Sphagnum jensenii]|uniref:Uncharacterized protein n=1 Tax=Sphagnum jensenii TaxID=128206 RepID=A0ABP1A053_9BRYO
MPHAQGRRSAVTPPLGSSSSTGLTTDFTGRQDTTDTGDEYVDPKSVICVRGIADGLTSFSFKGAMNELFERTIRTTGVLEFGKYAVRCSQFKDNSKQALVTLLNVEAATAILSVVKPLKIAGQSLVILPWSNMQQQKLQPLPKVNAGPEQPSSVHPPGLSSVECPPHVGQFGPPPQTGMVPLPFLPTKGQPDFGRPPLPSGPLCHPSFGPHNGIRPPPPWTPTPPIPSIHHLHSLEMGGQHHPLPGLSPIMACILETSAGDTMKVCCIPIYFLHHFSSTEMVSIECTFHMRIPNSGQNDYVKVATKLTRTQGGGSKMMMMRSQECLHPSLLLVRDTEEEWIPRGDG